MKAALRNRLTEDKIKAAFIDLILSKGFNQLTISDITKKAGMGRGTFYVHYDDKTDLLQKIERDLTLELQDHFAQDMPDLINTSPVDEAPKEIGLSTLTYLDSQRTTLQALLAVNGDLGFTREIRVMFKAQMTATMHQKQVTYTTKLPNDYAQEWFYSNIFSMFQWWLNKENPESPHEAARLLSRGRWMRPADLLVSQNLRSSSH